MSNKKPKYEFYSGVPWVQVDPAMVRDHPKGKLNAILWVIVVYFLATAVVKFWLTLDFGAGLTVAVLGSIWPFLAGVGLALRVPWSIIMAIVSTGLTAYAMVRSLGGEGSLFVLLETLINVGVLFYLMDGERPNFIYRHRYRKYSVERGDDDGGSV